MSKPHTVLAALLCVGLFQAEVRAENKEPPPAPAPDPEPRRPSAEASLFIAPYGMNYARSAIVLGAEYKIPLVQQPGILWDTTNLTIGIRNLYGWTLNNLGAYVEVTPIAFFKLQVYASYDVLIIPPFNGGLRVLTPLGRQRLVEGRIKPGDPDAIDWTDFGPGLDNRAIFTAPTPADGLRVKILPTLQGKVGPVGIQYNFTADFNFYRRPGRVADDVYLDGSTFTLRKMRDVGYFHEGVVAVTVPGVPEEQLLGVSGKYYHVPSTGMQSLSLGGLVFFRPTWRFFSGRLSPYIGGQAGTYLIDPIWKYSFSWVAFLGADFKIF